MSTVPFSQRGLTAHKIEKAARQSGCQFSYARALPLLRSFYFKSVAFIRCSALSAAFEQVAPDPERPARFPSSALRRTAKPTMHAESLKRRPHSQRLYSASANACATEEKPGAKREPSWKRRGRHRQSPATQWDRPLALVTICPREQVIPSVSPVSR